MTRQEQTTKGGDTSFQNNVPDPLLSGHELPTFKFELEKSQGKDIGNSFGKEATVEQLPISKGTAGVSMKIETRRAMRELTSTISRASASPKAVSLHLDAESGSKIFSLETSR